MMRRARLTALVVAAVLTWPIAGAAQDVAVRPYESEDDLWEAWQEGEIDFESYLFLLELVRAGLDSLLHAPSDIEALPGAPGYLPTADTAIWTSDDLVEAPPPATTTRRWRVRQRGGFDAPLGENEASGDGYTIWRVTGPGVRGVAHLKSGRDGTRVYARSLRVDRGRWRATFGDVVPRFGRGLVAGRRDRFIGTRGVERPGGTVVFPEGSRFNGALVTGRIGERLNLSVLESVVRSDNWDERATAADATFDAGGVSFGGAILHGSISPRGDSIAREFTGTYYGAHVGAQTGLRRWTGELAFDRDGVGARALELTHAAERWSVAGRAWSYHRDFVNPWGGGPALSERTARSLEGLDEEFWSRTSGERGFSLLTRSRVAPGTRIEVAWAVARTDPEDTRRSEWKAQALWQPAVGWTLRPYIRGDSEDNRPSSIRTGSYVDGRVSDALRVRVHSEFGRDGPGGRSSAWASGEFWWRINPAIELHPAVRVVDRDLDRSGDAYYYVYLTERITLAPDYAVTITLRSKRYEDSDRDVETEIRLRGSFGVGW